MLLPMARVQIIGTKPRRSKTVRVLHELGALQIDTWTETRATYQQPMSLTADATRLRERLAYLTTQVDAVLAVLPSVKIDHLPAGEERYVESPQKLLERVESDLTQVEPAAQKLANRRNQLEEQLSALPRYEATLQRLTPLIPALIDLETYTVSAVWLERRYQQILETMTQQLEELTQGRCEVLSREIDSDTLAAVLIFPKDQAAAVGKYLGQENISQVRLPTEFSNQPLNQALAEIRQRLRTIPQELAEIEQQQKVLARQWRPQLLLWQNLLRDHLAEIDICTHLGQTDYVFVVEGWIPEKDLPQLQTVLAQQVGDEVIINQLPLNLQEKENAPVAFNNPRLVKPFEPLVGLLAWPKAGHIDPTLLMAIFMPVFFGMILGDVAYGAILLVIMLYLRYRFKHQDTLRSLTEVLIMGSVWAIIFGFLFGEFLGTLGEELGLYPLWFDRAHNVEALFLLTLGIGAAHIVLGLCLGIWEAARHHERHELIEKIAMLVSLAALFLMVAIMADYLPNSFFTPAVALLVVGVAVLIYSMGALGILLGPLEFLGTIGNILSYLRIAAIGLSSIYLAQVANELAGSVGSLIVGLIIAILLHALNIALGAFSPTIQSLRLHYVEFFGKFYKGGGQSFRPFQRTISH